VSQPLYSRLTTNSFIRPLCRFRFISLRQSYAPPHSGRDPDQLAAPKARLHHLLRPHSAPEHRIQWDGGRNHPVGSGCLVRQYTCVLVSRNDPLLLGSSTDHWVGAQRRSTMTILSTARRRRTMAPLPSLPWCWPAFRACEASATASVRRAGCQLLHPQERWSGRRCFCQRRR
jgi:hypothetical protein